MIELAKQYVRELPVSMSLLGKHIVNLSSGPQNPLAYSQSLSGGVREIQRKTPGSTISTAAPCSIYVPAGVHRLTEPITITRHNVALTIDGGATIIPPTNQAAIVFDPTGTPEGYIKHWGLFIYGVIYGNASGANQHGVVFNDCIHGTAFINEIRALGGSGMVFDGSCFSNHISFNRIHGVAGWGVHSTGANNHNAIEMVGEVQACTLGGFNLRRWSTCNLSLRVENMSGGAPHIKLDGAQGIRLSAYFENASNTTGDDIVTAATDRICSDIVVEQSTVFKEQKTGSAYNINLPATTVNRFTIQGCTVYNATTRILNVAAGNTAVQVERAANIPLSGITNAAAGELRFPSYTFEASGNPLIAPANTSENIVKTFTVPQLGPNGRLELHCQVTCDNNANAKTFRIRLGGIGGTIHAEVALASTTGGRFVLYIQNQNATNSQVCFMHGATNTGTIKVWGQTVNTQDTTAGPSLVMTCLKATGGDLMMVNAFALQVFPAV